MPLLQVKSAAGTTQPKLGGGVIRSIIGVAAGTAYAFQIKDGPDSAGNTQTIIGQAAAVPVIAGVQYISQTAPIPFRDGLQVVVTGTPGEFEIQFD